MNIQEYINDNTRFFDQRATDILQSMTGPTTQDIYFHVKYTAEKSIKLDWNTIAFTASGTAVLTTNLAIGYRPSGHDVAKIITVTIGGTAALGLIKITTGGVLNFYAMGKEAADLHFFNQFQNTLEYIIPPQYIEYDIV